MSDEKSRLCIYRESIGLNQSEIAKLINIHQRNWSRYESGGVSPPEDVLLKLATQGLNLHWYHTGDGAMLTLNKKQESLPNGMPLIPGKKQDLLPDNKSIFGDVPLVSRNIPDGLIVPLLDQAVSAGDGSSLEEDATPDRFITVPKELSKYKSLSALPVRGDSMTPTLHEGDLVVCDSGGWVGDGVYVIRTNESAYVKRVIQTSKGYTVISDNKAYPSYSESKDDIEIVGKVRCAVVRVE